jgi:hypothetical protein
LTGLVRFSFFWPSATESCATSSSSSSSSSIVVVSSVSSTNSSTVLASTSINPCSTFLLYAYYRSNSTVLALIPSTFPPMLTTVRILSGNEVQKAVEITVAITLNSPGRMLRNMRHKREVTVHVTPVSSKSSLSEESVNSASGVNEMLCRVCLCSDQLCSE